MSIKTAALHKHGVLNSNYAEGRQKNKALKYRLARRAREVKESIHTYLKRMPENIIDLGTAEGRTLNELKKTFPQAHCTGIEYNPELVEIGKKMFPDLHIIQGDVMDLKMILDNHYDVAVATAVVEHLEEPLKFLQGCHRIIRPNGLLIMTCPDPFWEHIATMVGHLEDEQHYDVPNLEKLKTLCEDSGFKVLLAQKFMLSPIGMPFEIVIEKIFRSLRLNFMMANQLIVANPNK